MYHIISQVLQGEGENPVKANITSLLIPINSYTIFSILDEIKELLKVVAEKTIIKSVVASISRKSL